MPPVVIAGGIAAAGAIGGAFSARSAQKQAASAGRGDAGQRHRRAASAWAAKPCAEQRHLQLELRPPLALRLARQCRRRRDQLASWASLGPGDAFAARNPHDIRSNNGDGRTTRAAPGSGYGGPRSAIGSQGQMDAYMGYYPPGTGPRLYEHRSVPRRPLQGRTSAQSVLALTKLHGTPSSSYDRQHHSRPARRWHRPRPMPALPRPTPAHIMTRYRGAGTTGAAGGEQRAIRDAELRQLGGDAVPAQQGTNALNNMYAGTGMLQSGAAMKGIQNYGQQTALNNYFMPYMGLLGGQQAVGAGAASSVAGVGANFGNTAANINGRWATRSTPARRTSATSSSPTARTNRTCMARSAGSRRPRLQLLPDATLLMTELETLKASWRLARTSPASAPTSKPSSNA
jgi:hypothetical protein